MKRRTMLGLVVIAAAGLLSTAPLAKTAKPDATVKVSGKSVAAGIGVEWGKGTLMYHGKQHHFSVDGLSVLDVGIASIDATGSVYHLKKLEDFEGQYTAASAGAAVGGGAGVATMRNVNGVVLNLKAVTRGAELKAGADGIKITLEK
jgi:hypothetical protein